MAQYAPKINASLFLLSPNSTASKITYDFAAGVYYLKIAGKLRGAGTAYTLSVQQAKGK